MIERSNSLGLANEPHKIADALMSDATELKRVVMTLFNLPALPPFFAVSDSAPRLAFAISAPWLRYAVLIPSPEGRDSRLPKSAAS